MNIPKQIAIMQCPGHQRMIPKQTREIEWPIRAATQTAWGRRFQFPTWTCQNSNLTTQNKMRNEKINGDSNTDPDSIQKISTHSMILLPGALVYPVLKHIHEGTHYKRDGLMDLIRPHLKSPYLQKTIQKIIQFFQICAKNNPKTEFFPTGKTLQYKGIFPFEDWQVDFTQSLKSWETLKFFCCWDFGNWV